MKIIFIGSVQFSSLAIQQVLAIKDVDVIGVVTKSKSLINSDFCSLEGIAKQYGIPCLTLDLYSSEKVLEWISSKKPDVVYCFGWSHLLPKELLTIPPLGVIGYHPAELPHNRGRHPIIWTLALGLEKTASTFFFMDEGADSGDILSQVPINVEPSDDAGTLYQKLAESAISQIKEFTHQLSTGTYKRIQQDHSRASYWRKRGKQDGEIDWRMASKSIHDLVRALTRPYIGAHCCFEDREVKIWKTELINEDTVYSSAEPGKVLKVNNGTILIKCGIGSIRILEHEFSRLPEEGCYL
ncbi:methionyl-tRNA formyltransferase [Brevibacillus brevis]|uniref:methionyl-tRNA formyltransferase n=1 Tax=Brevibacillus brevis TaxID=1393 RepID=UPI0037C626E7